MPPKLLGGARALSDTTTRCHVESSPTTWDATVGYYEALLARSPSIALQQAWTVLVPSGEPPSQEMVADILCQGRPFTLTRGHISEHMDYHMADITVDMHDQGLVLYELGAQLRRREIVSSLSEHGDVYNLYWDVNANNMLQYAQDGLIRLAVDIFERHTWPSDATHLLEELCVFGATNTPRAAAMAVLELRSGFRLTTDWLDSAHDAIVYNWLER